jgi:hypothetical protein
MKRITLSEAAFMRMLSKLIESGVTFEAEQSDDKIVVTFTGGY